MSPRTQPHWLPQTHEVRSIDRHFSRSKTEIVCRVSDSDEEEEGEDEGDTKVNRDIVISSDFVPRWLGLEWISNLVLLTRLDLSFNREITDNDIGNLFSSLRRLEILNLLGCSKIIGKTLHQGLRQALPPLREVNLAKTGLSTHIGATVEAILDCNRKHRKLVALSLAGKHCLYSLTIRS